MFRRISVCTASAVTALAIGAPSALAEERLLTLYSPKIDSQPYVHDTHEVALRANGREAPAQAGYITGIKEQALVDSKNPKAKPLPNSKMMIHHLLYYAPGREEQLPGSCWGQSGFIAGRGEEHPSGDFGKYTPEFARRKYGITNRLPGGKAPDWTLTAMVMNHYKRPKSFYVRTRVWYTTDKRTPITPIVVGNCKTLDNGMSYDVPGGGKKGSNYVDRSAWKAPVDSRIVLAHSHQHGGGKYHTLSSRTCDRRLLKAPVYHGTKGHIYNTIRPVLHEPGPIATGAFGTLTGIPVAKGEVLSRAAVHDNSNLHVASMGFWVLFMAADDSVGRCERVPKDVVELAKPKRYDRTPNHALVVPQLFKPKGAYRVFSGNPLAVNDDFFTPRRLRAKVGQEISWNFQGTRRHSVTVANGPRGFSSVYWGQTRGTYKVKPKVRGTYRLTCLVHPTTMGQTLVVR